LRHDEYRGGQTDRAARPPADVERSVRLWWFTMTGVVIYDVLGLVFPQHDVLVGLQVRMTTVTHRIASGIVASLVILVAELAIGVLLIYHVGRGNNTARIWPTVLAALSEYGGLTGPVADFYAPTGA
jgi:hypothetical protein